MLVLAAPRPPESQEVAEKEITTTENFVDSSYKEILLLGTSIDPIQVPLSALSARARHREKVRSYSVVLLVQTKPGPSKTSDIVLNFNHQQLYLAADGYPLI